MDYHDISLVLFTYIELYRSFDSVRTSGWKNAERADAEYCRMIQINAIHDFAWMHIRGKKKTSPPLERRTQHLHETGT